MVSIPANRSNAIKKVFLNLLGDLPKVSWKGLLYHGQVRPKAIFNMWLQVQDRLLIADRLLKWGIQIDNMCSLCKLAVDTRDHLFVECALYTVYQEQVT